jgi:hypothetical protein
MHLPKHRSIRFYKEFAKVDWRKKIHRIAVRSCEVNPVSVQLFPSILGPCCEVGRGEYVRSRRGSGGSGNCRAAALLLLPAPPRTRCGVAVARCGVAVAVAAVVGATSPPLPPSSADSSASASLTD